MARLPKKFKSKGVEVRDSVPNFNTTSMAIYKLAVMAKIDTYQSFKKKYRPIRDDSHLAWVSMIFVRLFMKQCL